MAYAPLALALIAAGLLLSVEGLARVTWGFSLFRMRKLARSRAERRGGASPTGPGAQAQAAGLVAIGLTLATIGLYLYLR